MSCEGAYPSTTLLTWVQSRVLARENQEPSPYWSRMHVMSPVDAHKMTSYIWQLARVSQDNPPKPRCQNSFVVWLPGAHNLPRPDGTGGTQRTTREDLLTIWQMCNCATVQPLTWNIRATVGPARCNCEHYVKTKLWLAMEAPAGLGRLLWAISCPVVEVLVLVPLGPETKPRLTQSKWNWSARAGECSRYLTAWPFLSHRDKWYHKKTQTNSRQIQRYLLPNTRSGNT